MFFNRFTILLLIFSYVVGFVFGIKIEQAYHSSLHAPGISIEYKSKEK